MPPLPGWYSDYVPRVQCPPSHPWLLHQQFNGGSGFRIGLGIEFSGYNPGFDAVAMSSLTVPYEKNGQNGQMRVGISGARDLVLNSVTNWAFGSTPWTVTAHCTSDPDKGVFDPPASDP